MGNLHQFCLLADIGSLNMIIPGKGNNNVPCTIDNAML